MLDGLTVREAAGATGWSARMLRYIEQNRLVIPPRSRSGYRLYGEAELRRLRELRELLVRHHVSLDDVGFALRMRRDARLRDDVDAWLEAIPPHPEEIAPIDWLRWEQRKHQRLVAVA